MDAGIYIYIDTMYSHGWVFSWGEVEGMSQSGAEIFYLVLSS